MKTRMAFIGFQHGHIVGLYKLAQQREDIEVVAACEEDAETRANLAAQGVAITHDSYPRMLDEAKCDVVACGDWFGIRGQRLIDAMERGLHVIGDKPLCTTLDECERIAALAQGGLLLLGLRLPDCHVLRLGQRGAARQQQAEKPARTPTGQTAAHQSFFALPWAATAAIAAAISAASPR